MKNLINRASIGAKKTNYLFKARWLQGAASANESKKMQVNPRITPFRFACTLLLFLTLSIGNAWGANNVPAPAGTYNLVTNASNLAAGDVIIITGTAASGTGYAISTTQNNNNRGQASVTISNNSITIPANNTTVQGITLEAGTTSGTLSFKVGDNGYLYAASSGSNYLRTESEKSANSSWTITISNSDATVTAQGSYSRKLMRHNSGSSIFACYATNTTTGTAVRIFKKAAAAYSVTASSNNNSWGTVSVTGTTITATPNSGYRVMSGTDGYTVTSGTATVVNNGDNTFTVTPSSNCTVRINFESKGCTDHGASSITSGASSGDDYGPIHAYYKYSTSQILYTKSDLDLAVGKKGTIKSIYFEYSGAAAMAARTIKIYMANTDLSSLTTSNYVPYASFTQVYSGTFSCGSAGWYEITLDTPFDYNGAGQLAVMIDDNTNTYESSKSFKYHSATGKQIYKRQDDTDIDPASWTPASAIDYRPNTKFCIQEADMTPVTVTLMDNSETITEASAGAGVTLPSRAGCTGYTFAGWTKTWTEEQDEWTTTAPTIIPAGSYTPSANENLYPVYTKTEGGGDGFKLSLEYSSTEYYIAPRSGSNAYLGATTNAAEAEIFYIEDDDLYYLDGETKTYVNSNTNTTSLTFVTSEPVGWTITNSDGVWTFQSKGTGSRHLAWNYNSGSPRFASYTGSSTYLYHYTKHSLSTTSYISVPNCCDAPSALTKGTISLSDRTAQKQPINWTSAAGKVDICYSTSSTTPDATPSGSYTVASDITTSPYDINITSLDAGNYYVWARSVCAADSKSDWVAVTGSYFNIPSHTLTITADPVGTGTFTKSPDISTVVENRQVTITASPESGYNFTSWSVSGASSTLSSTSANPTTFTMGTANSTVTGTFTAKEVTGWTWKQQSTGETEITIPDVVNLYVGQQAWFNLKSYTPADVIAEKKGYSSSYTGADLAEDVKAGAYYKTRAKAVTASTTLTLTSSSNSSVKQEIIIRITALPSVTFTDIIHEETFGVVTATVDADDKRVVYTTKKTPTHADFSGEGANECEDEHVHLVGWILEDWVVEHPNASSSDISTAGAGNFYGTNVDIDLVAKNGKTFYAVWSKVEIP